MKPDKFSDSNCGTDTVAYSNSIACIAEKDWETIIDSARKAYKGGRSLTKLQAGTNTDAENDVSIDVQAHLFSDSIEPEED